MRAPVTALKAMIFILLSTTGVVAYITPSTTIGVVSKLAVMPVWISAAGLSVSTLLSLICLSGE